MKTTGYDDSCDSHIGDVAPINGYIRAVENVKRAVTTTLKVNGFPVYMMCVCFVCVRFVVKAYHYVSSVCVPRTVLCVC